MKDILDNRMNSPEGSLMGEFEAKYKVIVKFLII